MGPERAAKHVPAYAKRIVDEYDASSGAVRARLAMAAPGPKAAAAEEKRR
jgi:hypothetical protein